MSNARSARSSAPTGSSSGGAGASSASRAGASRCRAASSCACSATGSPAWPRSRCSSRLPLLGAPLAAAPASLRLLALPIAAAWALSRWEVDGRAPHRALAGLGAWWLRPRVARRLRRCPAPGAELAPLERLSLAPDLERQHLPARAPSGPARLLLRYPVRSSWRGVRGAGGRARGARRRRASLATSPRRRARHCTRARRWRCRAGRTVDLRGGAE